MLFSTTQPTDRTSECTRPLWIFSIPVYHPIAFSCRIVIHIGKLQARRSKFANEELGASSSCDGWWCAVLRLRDADATAVNGERNTQCPRERVGSNHAKPHRAEAPGAWYHRDLRDICDTASHNGARAMHRGEEHAGALRCSAERKCSRHRCSGSRTLDTHHAARARRVNLERASPLPPRG